jgi:hypothetical protein
LGLLKRVSASSAVSFALNARPPLFGRKGSRHRRKRGRERERSGGNYEPHKKIKGKCSTRSKGDETVDFTEDTWYLGEYPYL